MTSRRSQPPPFQLPAALSNVADPELRAYWAAQKDALYRLWADTQTTVTTDIIASTTQTQAGATVLVSDHNYIGTCANTNDSVKLPPASKGREVLLVNEGANAAKIWPDSDDAIDGGSVDAADSNTLASGAVRWYSAKDGINWTTV